jgi:hypothetical protein
VIEMPPDVRGKLGSGGVPPVPVLFHRLHRHPVEIHPELPDEGTEIGATPMCREIGISTVEPSEP